MTALFTLQFTLTETHVGGAGAIGAVDLPIVREATTGLPFLPETALKGVARDAAAAGPHGVGHVDDLFGPRGDGTDLRAGELVFTQGHLLLYPLRCLQRPFVYATSSLLLSRLDRVTRAFGVALPGQKEQDAWRSLLHDSDEVRVGSTFGPTALVLEDSPFATLVKDGDAAGPVGRLGALLALWMPGDEGDTGKRIQADLVVLPDAALAAIVSRAAPVRARIRLDKGSGTTSGDDGNLWYEEMLPSDCLFWSVVSERDAKRQLPKRPVETFSADILPALRQTQIGGGASTGHGRIWWWAPGATPPGGAR